MDLYSTIGSTRAAASDSRLHTLGQPVGGNRRMPTLTQGGPKLDLNPGLLAVRQQSNHWTRSSRIHNPWLNLHQTQPCKLQTVVGFFTSELIWKCSWSFAGITEWKKTLLLKTGLQTEWKEEQNKWEDTQPHTWVQPTGWGISLSPEEKETRTENTICSSLSQLWTSECVSTVCVYLRVCVQNAWHLLSRTAHLLD